MTTKRNASRKSPEAPGRTENTNTTSSMPDCSEVFSQLQIDAVAKYAHEAWADYMAYHLGQLIPDEAGNLIVPLAYVQALTKQIDTPYDKLSAAEKKLDIEEAKKICMLFYIG